MELKILEEDKGFLKLEVRGESPTLTGLIADAAAREGADAAAIQEHPFMAEPKIVISDSNPKKVLERAATAVVDDLDAFKEDLRRELGK